MIIVFIVHSRLTYLYITIDLSDRKSRYNLSLPTLPKMIERKGKRVANLTWMGIVVTPIIDLTAIHSWTTRGKISLRTYE